ncbi:hypothetical protein H920_16384 [Fukomys damarensis]|uniref:Uncharacterized protein n=1 Tax=Fukomys damarensis TaxID=885580 RepID=A0A091CWP0_FUKDA|nr:hypothetical protein H920_16384 [Fukomys damarensis]
MNEVASVATGHPMVTTVALAMTAHPSKAVLLALLHDLQVPEQNDAVKALVMALVPGELNGKAHDTDQDSRLLRSLLSGTITARMVERPFTTFIYFKSATSCSQLGFSSKHGRLICHDLCVLMQTQAVSMEQLTFVVYDLPGRDVNSYNQCSPQPEPLVTFLPSGATILEEPHISEYPVSSGHVCSR